MAERLFCGEKIESSSGVKIKAEKILKGKMIGLYFASGTCTSCRNFTHHLMRVYHDIKNNKNGGSDFEIVLISSDQKEEDFLRFVAEMNMPWPRIPFSSGLISKLQQAMDVQYIPALFIVCPTGDVLTHLGTSEIIAMGSLAFDQWLLQCKTKLTQ